MGQEFNWEGAIGINSPDPCSGDDNGFGLFFRKKLEN
jgi:hypothetical protein